MAQPSAADGAFAIKADLNPGDYTLEIDPPSDTRISAEDTKPDPQDYGRTYFPGVPRAEMASPIAISPGENRDIELRLHKHELHHIAGVFQVPEGLESNAIAISVTAGGQIVRPLVKGEVPRSGVFRIDGLDEGTYRVEAALKSADGFAIAFGGESVDVGSHSIDDLKITLQNGLSVMAHIAMAEDQVDAPKGLQFGINSYPAPYFAGVTSVMSIRISSDHLLLEGYPAGEYWPALKVPEGYAVTSVSFNERPVLNSTIDLESSESVVSYILTSRPASVSGIVRDDNQKPLPGKIVVLLPELLPESLERFNSAAMHVATADGSGGFRFTSLAPGKYEAIVLGGNDRERVERAPDFDFLRDLPRSPIILEFGQNATLDLYAR